MQLYIIHGWYKGRMIPFAWILMKKRKVRDYMSVFRELKRFATSNDITLNPKTAFIDFEKAARTAYMTSWRTISVKSL
jgi:hypothetical protein